MKKSRILAAALLAANMAVAPTCYQTPPTEPLTPVPTQQTVTIPQFKAQNSAESQEVLDKVMPYFIEYFGPEHKNVIVERLNRTSLYFVGPTRPSKKHIEKYISDINTIAVYSDEANKNIADTLFHNINNIVLGSSGSMGYHFLATGSIGETKISLISGVFVKDLGGTEYEGTRLDAYSDVNTIHELVHTVTRFIKNNEDMCGVNKCEKSGDEQDFYEWLVENMAIDIAKTMHADGIVLNKRISSENAVYDLSVHCGSEESNEFFNKHKELYKHAVLTGDYEMAARTLKEKENGRKKISGYCARMMDKVIRVMIDIKEKYEISF